MGDFILSYNQATKDKMVKDSAIRCHRVKIVIRFVLQ